MTEDEHTLGSEPAAQRSYGRVLRWAERVRPVSRRLLLLALQMALISMFAYIVGFRFTSLFHGPSAKVGALWCAITGVMVLQTTRRETWKEGTRQVLGAVIGAAAGGVCLYFMSFSPVGLAIAVGITVLLCEISGLSDSTKLAVTSVIMIMIIAGQSQNLHPLGHVALRVSEAILGAGIALAMSLLLYGAVEKGERTEP